MKRSVVPDGFAEDPNVPLHIKGMMLILGRFLDFQTGYGFPSQKLLAECAGVRPKHVSRLLIEAASFGYLDMDHVGGHRVEYRIKGGPLRLPIDRRNNKKPRAPDSPYSGNPVSPYSGNPDSPYSGNPIQYRSVLSADMVAVGGPETAELLLILERRGVDDGARAEIVDCRAAAEIRDWVAAVPYQIAKTGGKVVKSEAAILVWALRRSVGPEPRPLPLAFVQRRQIDLAAAASNEVAKQEAAAAAVVVDERTPDERRAIARANMPEFIRRKVESVS